MKTLSSIMVVLMAMLVLAGQAGNEELRIGENLRHERVLLPYSSPDKTRLIAIDRMLVTGEEGDLSILIFYDDLGTRLAVDYIELYDINGDLLAISWIDRFGICQVAMERGLLDEEDPMVEGVLVMSTGGVSV